MSEVLHTTGVWKVEYPEKLKEAVLDSSGQWEEFCNLPDSVQDIFTSDNMFNGSGFERKTGTGGAEGRFSNDKKMNFDVKNRDLESLEAQLLQIDDMGHREIARSFLASASQLAKEAPAAINEFGRRIEELGVPGFQALAQQSAEGLVFRYLNYPPTQEAGEVIGEPHVDNSGFTLHLFESTDGCEALDSDRQTWYPMPVADGQALAFPSMQTQLYSEGVVDGLCHRILANEETHEVGRIAIVCFIALDGMPPYDRERHGRLQKMTPGFNYGMDPTEFAGLFVPREA